MKLYDRLSLPMGIALLLGVASLVAMTGCVGYKLGSNLPADVGSVYVPVFVNETDEPGLEAVTTSAAIQEIQKDGSLKVAPEAEASCVLQVKLRSYKLIPVRYRRDQTTTAQEYRLEIGADYVMTKRLGGKVIAQGTHVVGFSNFTALTDLPSARRAALPATASDLAHRMVREITEAW